MECLERAHLAIAGITAFLVVLSYGVLFPLYVKNNSSISVDPTRPQLRLESVLIPLSRRLMAILILRVKQIQALSRMTPV